MELSSRRLTASDRDMMKKSRENDEGEERADREKRKTWLKIKLVDFTEKNIISA